MITVIISSNNTKRKVKDSPRIHNELCQVPYNPKIPSKIICAPTPNMAADTRSNVMSKNGLDSSKIWRYQWELKHTRQEEHRKGRNAERKSVNLKVFNAQIIF